MAIYTGGIRRHFPDRPVGDDVQELIMERQERLACMLVAMAAQSGNVMFATALKRLWTGEDTLDLEPLGQPPADDEST